MIFTDESSDISEAVRDVDSADDMVCENNDEQPLNCMKPYCYSLITALFCLYFSTYLMNVFSLIKFET
jgi:hypothetical protein